MRYPPMHEVFLAQRKSMQYSIFFELYGKLGRMDRQDRLYGLLSLVTWPVHIEPITSAHGIPLFQLYIQVQAYISFEDIPRMLEALRSSISETIREIVARGDRDSRVALAVRFQAPQARSRMLRKLCGPKRCEWLSCARLCGSDGLGNLTCALVKDGVSQEGYYI